MKSIIISLVSLLSVSIPAATAFKPFNSDLTQTGHYQYGKTAKCYDSEGTLTKRCGSRCFNFDVSVTPALGSKAGDVVIRNALDVDNCDCFDNTNGWVAKADHPPTFSKGKGLSANTFSWSLNDASSQQGSPFINCEYDLLTRSHHCTSKNVDGVTCSGHVKFQAKYVKPRKTVSITGDEQ